MATKPKGSNAMAAAMAAAQGPQRPEYVSQENWDEMTDDQKTYAADPANIEAVKAAYADDTDDNKPATEDEKIDGAAMAVNQNYLPTSFNNITTDLASKVSEQDRERVIEVVEKEMSVKAETVALVLVIERAYGKGAVSLPHYGSTEGNNPDVFKYKKKTSSGKFAKKESDGSVLEITAYKAMVPLGLHNEIAEIEKKVASLGKGAQVPYTYATKLSALREKRNKLVKKFVFAVRLVHVLHDIGEMSKVGWSWIADDGTTDIADDMSNLHIANECILLYAKGKDGQRGMSLAVSPSVVLDYRPVLSQSESFGGNAVGSLDNLLASPEPPTPEQTEGEQEIPVNSFDDGTKVTRAFHKWLLKFIGPAASKTDAKAFNEYLKSAAGSELIVLLFSSVEILEEGVTSRDELRAQENRVRTNIERAMGGNANRQVKDQQDGAVAA